jgi:hypothetical protein
MRSFCVTGPAGVTFSLETTGKTAGSATFLSSIDPYNDTRSLPLLLPETVVTLVRKNK